MDRRIAWIALLLFCMVSPLTLTYSYAQGLNTNALPAVSSGPTGTGAPASPSRRKARPQRGRSSGTNGSPSVAAASTAGQQREPVTQDSPILPVSTLTNSLGVPSGTPIQVQISTAVDSAHSRNGDTIAGSLTVPLAGLPAGTPVSLTVISASAAGTIQSYGEISIQILSVNGHPILSNMVSATGQEGRKELPDAAPEKGTDAGFPAGTPITFTVA